ncbi:MAG: hypothetical protein ACE5Q6_23325 [Dehalococcoidia bacterium]
MALVRGFTQIEDTEDGETLGRMPLPTQILHLAGFSPGYPVEYQVLRLKGTGRPPHVFFHRPDCPPWVSPMEVVFLRGVTSMNEEGHLTLTGEMQEWTKIRPTDILEVKVAGPRGAHWLVLYNRGEYRFLGRGVFPGRGAHAQEKQKAELVKGMVGDFPSGREEERRRRKLKEMLEKEWRKVPLNF